MEKIKNIKVGKYNFYKITLASGEVLSVSERVMAAEILYKDKELSAEKIEELKAGGSLDWGFELALYYLSFKMRTSKEIAEYLKKHDTKKQFNEEIISKVIFKLQEYKYINDAEYAKMFVNDAINLTTDGRRKIAQKLKQKGITELDVMSALDEIDSDDELFNAKKLAEKLIRKYEKESARNRIEKTRQSMMTKGYNRDVIDAAIAAHLPEVDESEELEKIKKLIKKNNKIKDKFKMKTKLFTKGFSTELINRAIGESDVTWD
ncbi:MAG: RecX family transcriptional regulator [Lactobacillales bacterium]|jgi:regulatory protein|nr:RecX family transcriptional regulator [Lactobacillales bacterium]